ncbi:DedA family protein [Paenibacillus hodogayensis]|uniref:DedA family protein n=1 Tax=Paenibacillus hodogayensis TaxID=279208 RepID=A0ABV5VT77_9BACL
MEWMNVLFEQYGYVLLFFGLFAESLALPFPGELAMAISGNMAYLGNSNIWLDMLFSFSGAVIGTMLTYWLGRRLGAPFFAKYGKYIFLKRERLDKLSSWFGKYGTKIILVSYFVPGLRHFTGYVSGIMNIRLGTFMLYNTASAVIWVAFYVSVGRLFGPQLEQLLHLASAYSWRAAALLIAGFALMLYIKKLRVKLQRKRVDERGFSES